MHRCSDFHVNGALQIFYDDDDDYSSGHGYRPTGQDGSTVGHAKPY